MPVGRFNLVWYVNIQYRDTPADVDYSIAGDYRMLAHNSRTQNGISPPIYTIQMLPLDILIGIMALVKPSDIIRLRQVSQHVTSE